MLILALKGFPVVPMGIQRDPCSAGLLNDPTSFATKSFSEIFANSSERGERARDKLTLAREIYDNNSVAYFTGPTEPRESFYVTQGGGACLNDHYDRLGQQN